MGKYINSDNIKNRIRYLRNKNWINPVVAIMLYNHINMYSKDVAPVVHARWIQIDNDKCKCNNCECTFFIASNYGNKNYCPNCGAKMDGDKK